MKVSSSILSLALCLFSGEVLAHPGHDISNEIRQRSEYLSTAKRTSLSHCSAKMKRSGSHGKMVARRNAKVEELRQKRGITKRSYLQARDLTDVLNTDHESNLTGITPETDPVTLFGSVPGCVLSPEVTEGPYYVTGESVRSNITEDQAGIPLYVEIQVTDSETCEPIADVALEAWHCNSTGVYGGVVASGNGNEADTTNLQNKALRGIQFSDDDGVLTFETIFPGHYTGRATHIHVLSHLGASEQTNGTISTGQISHVGQIFFDQDLISLVEATSPYSTNTQNLTTNEEDSILAEEADSSDPVVEYVLLGDTVDQGIFSWINFGINSTLSKTVNAASSCYADGCVENENSGSAPSGAFPSGTPA